MLRRHHIGSLIRSASWVDGFSTPTSRCGAISLSSGCNHSFTTVAESEAVAQSEPVADAEPPAVVIVGGGVGGLTLAAALATNGTSFRLIERGVGLGGVTLGGKGTLAAPDRGLGIWPNAREALRRLDVWPRVASTMIPSAGYRDIAGRWLSRCTPSEENHSKV